MEDPNHSASDDSSDRDESFNSYQNEDEQESLFVTEGKGIHVVSAKAVYTGKGAVRSKSFYNAPLSSFSGFHWRSFLSGALLMLALTFVISVIRNYRKDPVMPQPMPAHDAPPATTMMMTRVPTLEPTIVPTIQEPAIEPIIQEPVIVPSTQVVAIEPTLQEPVIEPTTQPTLEVGAFPTGVPSTLMPVYATGAPSFEPTQRPLRSIAPTARKKNTHGPTFPPDAAGSVTNDYAADVSYSADVSYPATMLNTVRTTASTGTGGEFTGEFTLASPLGGYLDSQYTCTDADGNLQDGTSPPMEFINPPAGTTQYLLTMSSVYGKTGTEKFNWVVYGIGGDAAGIDEGCTVASCAVGTIGGTYPGEPVEYKYKAPCASVSGVHSIAFTLYALSGDITPHVVPGETDKMPELLQIAEDSGYVLAKTTTSLSYCTCYCTDADSSGTGSSRRDRNRNRDRSLREVGTGASSMSSRALDTFCEK
jgi:Phosphatidylethanolamine-binding protein